MDGLRPFLAKLPQGAVIVETGRARGESAGHRTGDGWSTLLLARTAQELDGLLISVDINAATESVCRKLLGKALCKHVRFLNGLSDEQLKWPAFIEALAGRRIRFALLDSARDPNVAKYEFLALEPHLAGHGYVAIDDSAVKGRYLVPILRGRDEWIEQRLDDPVVFQWRPKK